MDVCFDRRFTGRLFVVPGRLGAARSCGRRPDSKPTEGDAESRGQPHQRPAAEQHQFWSESRLPKSGRVEYSARDTNWNLERLEPAPPLDYADHLPASAERTGTPETGEYGLGDMQPTFFISPKKPGKLIWGVGPVLQLPTATNTFLGQGKLGIGPSTVVLTQPGHWTLGLLENNVWSVAGSGSRPAVNQFLMQYFINYNLKKGWFIGVSPIITANWEASRGNVWTVPFGGGIGRIMKFGAQPVSLVAQFYGNAVHPANTPAWTLRLQISFLFPKLSKEQQERLMEKQLKQLEQEPH